MLTISADKNFRLKLDKIVDEQMDFLLKDLFNDFESYFDSWANDLRQALSVEAPEEDRKRWSATRDRNRRFPYTRSDNDSSLKNSLRLQLDTHRTAKSQMIKASVGFDSKHAYYTDEGIRAPKYAAQGAWVGWAKDIFFGNGRDGIQGVRGLFDEFTKRRRAI